MDILVITVRPIHDDEFATAAQVIRSSVLPHLDAEGLSLEIIERILLKYDDISLRQKFKPGNLYVAIMNDQLVGLAGLIESEPGLFNRVSTLFIHPSAQGKGIGKALLAEIEQRVCNDGGKKLLVNSRSNAEGFYAKFGFIKKDVEEKMHSDGKTSCTILMEKTLT